MIIIIAFALELKNAKYLCIYYSRTLFHSELDLDKILSV